ncbi:MAG TPA: ABC transporter ATP-binding protein [Firmicutes bacterium]|nr:ABC transporter ATP-binding protein [Bacillota bacterium]
MMDLNAVVVSGLRKVYGSVKAVDNLDLRVESGQVFGMLGPNGAGKTTTVEILVGLRSRDAGEVSIMGLDPAKQAREVKSRIGVQLQTHGLYPRLTVRELVCLFASFYKNPLPPDEVIERVGLTAKARTIVKALSGGQVQRLAVALAMVNDAELVFLDEPTTGLDPQARRGLWDVIRHMREQGKTVFLTTHYMEEAERLCDTVAIVDHGKIIAQGPPSSLIIEHFQEQAVEFSNFMAADRERLELLPGVTRTRFDGDRATLYTRDIPRTIAGLMELAEGNGVTIGDVTVRRSTLEDVFLKLTGRRIREE